MCLFPKEYEDLSEEAKETRSTISSDLCSIDNIHFFIRGLIEISLLPPPLPSHLIDKTNISDKENTSNNEGNNNENSSSEDENLKVIVGVWVKLEVADFFKVMEEWNLNSIFTVNGKLNSNLPLSPPPSPSLSSSSPSPSSSHAPPSPSVNSSPSQPSINTLNLSVSLTTRPDGLRPIVEIINQPDHLLSIYQHNGISLDALEPFLSSFFHSNFNVL